MLPAAGGGGKPDLGGLAQIQLLTRAVTAANKSNSSRYNRRQQTRTLLEGGWPPCVLHNPLCSPPPLPTLVDVACRTPHSSLPALTSLNQSKIYRLGSGTSLCGGWVALGVVRMPRTPPPAPRHRLHRRPGRLHRPPQHATSLAIYGIACGGGEVGAGGAGRFAGAGRAGLGAGAARQSAPCAPLPAQCT